MNTQILVADDHPLFRQGLIKTIEGHSLFNIIAEANDGVQALNKIKELKPDIAILDISMPKMSGLEIVKKIRNLNLDVKIIILTMYTEEEFFSQAIELDIKGYISKESAGEDLITALERVSNGGSYISPLLSDNVFKLEKERRFLVKTKPGLSNLTPAERQILKYLSENKSSKQIAEKLFISYKTVENHRANIRDKLNLKGLNALLKFAIENKSKL
tara:strand:+ start:11412 stop:12059 length:648 start_codon:yes stop_codon:yes gene_type:complete